ncbi:MAG: carbohydrate transporter rane protein 1, family [Acidimicrobiaceae bacterium]|nr:carbohydrate transporter rane protein 1, family [Acidimicrobiaceae bacterium]
MAWLLVAPTLAVLVAMTIAAGVYVFWVSFYRIGSFGTGNQAVGWLNYRDAFSTYDFLPDLLRTVGYVAVSVGIELVAGIALGVSLARRVRGNRLAAALLIVPFATTPAVSALVFRSLLDPNYGWIDYYLRSFGLHQPIQWLSHPTTAWISLIGLDVWEWTPFVALVVLSGLQSLRTDVVEAARVDGASALQRFRYITLPMLTPFLAIAAVLRVIQSFKTFDIFLILTNGGPGTGTETVNLQIYRLVMQDFSIGQGAAIAVMLLVVLLLLTPLLLKTIGHYAEHERGVS